MKEKKISKINYPRLIRHRPILIGICIIFFLYILLVFLDSLSQLKTLEIPEECKLLDTLEEKENCVEDLDSKKYLTIKSCDQISEEEITPMGLPRKDRCLFRFASNNPELCGKLKDFSLRETCYTIAVPRYGKSWCNFIEREVQKQACLEDAEKQGY